jgi:N-(2-amino-2-carboxyethyl)-L-glutamate synthase
VRRMISRSDGAFRSPRTSLSGAIPRTSLTARVLARRWVPIFNAAIKGKGDHIERGWELSGAKRIAGGSWVGYLLSWRATQDQRFAAKIPKQPKKRNASNGYASAGRIGKRSSQAKCFEEINRLFCSWGSSAMIIESPLELIFRDLFYRLPAFAGGNDVFLKLEGFNVTGSIKIKTAIRLIEEFEQRGIVKPHESLIVESSSGNLGLALSLVCAIKGYKFICVTDPNANRATIRGIELYGAKVVVVEDRDPAGGYLESRLKKIDQILQSDPNAVWLNQYANIANKNVHAEQTANEIAREFDKVDWVFVGTGTTGTLAGISEGLRQEFPRIKVVAVEPAGSVTFGGSPGKRNIPGIGTSMRPKLADLAKPDRIVVVNEEKTVEACRSFVRDHHLLVGGSTGTVLAAVEQLAPDFSRGDIIVAVSADLGEKYLDTIYDPTWVEEFIVPEDNRPTRTYALVAAE